MPKLEKLSALWISALLAVMLATSGFGPAFAQSKIVVVVNNDAITSYELNQRAKLLKLFGGRQSEARLQKMAQTELVDERLKLQEANKRRITIDKSEVDDAVASIAKRVKLPLNQFNKALISQGVQPQTLRQRLHANILWNKVLRARFNATVRISEQDVVAKLLSSNETSKEFKTTEYDLQQVIVVVPKNASKNAVAQRQRDANNLRSRFTDCQSGLEMIKNLKGVVVKKIGVRTSGEIPAQYKKHAEETPAGKLTKDIRTTQGFEMLAICEKREISSDVDARALASDEMRSQEGQLMARRYLRDLRRDAVIEYR